LYLNVINNSCVSLVLKLIAYLLTQYLIYLSKLALIY